MVRTVLRTLLVGLISGLVLGLLLLPVLDAMGRILPLPPVFHPAARILLVALWLAGMKAAWSYEPVMPGPEETTGDDGPPDPSTHAGGP